MKSSRIHLSVMLFAMATCAAAAGSDRPVDFPTQIIPVLTKSGCNAGACHGAAVGRGGFKLSLYGGDPAADYVAVVQQLEGRRINLAKPERSLILRKPTGKTAHGGGLRLKPNGAGAKLLHAWVASGAPPGGKRTLQSLTVTPRTYRLESPGGKVVFRIAAEFSDGSRADVTDWTVFSPEDPSAVEIAKYGRSSVGIIRRRGEHIVIARFLDRVVPIRIVIPLANVRVDHSRQLRRNFIDDHVLKKLETLRLPVSKPASDSVYLRRVTLDLTGRLPTPKEVDAFFADKRNDKRERLVDRLLKSDAFVDYWTHHFAELLRIRSQPKDVKGAFTYHRWLRTQIRRGTPMDRMARTLLSATGDSHDFGPANFYRTAGDARAQAEFVSELFMGVRLRCANCHNHPLDQWTQDDYHGFAAIFARVKTGRVVSLGMRGEVAHPRTGQPAVPRIPGQRYLGSSGKDRDGRRVFGDWLTAKGNPYFAKAIVNRLWRAMMGRGLVEPADDLRATNPPTHPRLLEELAADFETRGYNIRRTLRLIALSAAYARSSLAVDDSKTGLSNKSDNRYYSRALVRKLSPAVLFDAVCEVTGVPEQFGNQPVGTKAVNLFDARIPSTTLDILGRCDRSGSCESGGTTGGGLSAKLHWINGEFLNRRISDSKGRLQQSIAAGVAGEATVKDFYRRALSRPPSPKERQFWRKRLRMAKTSRKRREMLEDFVWSLLSSREFLTR